MNKFKSTLIFYVIAFAIVYGLNKLSPGQQDGGPGFGSLAIVLLVLVVFVLAAVNAFKGIKHGKHYLLLAGIHLLVLLAMAGTLFL